MDLNLIHKIQPIVINNLTEVQIVPLLASRKLLKLAPKSFH